MKHFVSHRTLPETYWRECGMGPLNETVKPTVLQSYIEVKPINSSFIAKGNKQTPARLLSSPTHCLSHLWRQISICQRFVSKLSFWYWRFIILLSLFPDVTDMMRVRSRLQTARGLLRELNFLSTTFYGDRKHAAKIVFFSLWTWLKRSLGIQLQGNAPTFDNFSRDKIWKNTITFRQVIFSLPSSSRNWLSEP